MYINLVAISARFPHLLSLTLFPVTSKVQNFTQMLRIYHSSTMLQLCALPIGQDRWVCKADTSKSMYSISKSNPKRMEDYHQKRISWERQIKEWSKISSTIQYSKYKSAFTKMLPLWHRESKEGSLRRVKKPLMKEIVTTANNPKNKKIHSGNLHVYVKERRFHQNAIDVISMPKKAIDRQLKRYSYD